MCKSKKCKISSWLCIYHACMSDDCQKNEVFKNGINWGPGKCQENINHTPSGCNETPLLKEVEGTSFFIKHPA